MVAVVEPDRRLARRLKAALAARGCAVRLAHGSAAARTLLARKRPRALYVAEPLGPDNGGDLLAELDRDRHFASMPVVVRVSRHDSVFARTMRRGGVHTMTAPVDVEAAATMLARMASGDEGVLRRLVYEAYELRARTKANRARAEAVIERSRQLVGRRG